LDLFMVGLPNTIIKADLHEMIKEKVHLFL